MVEEDDGKGIHIAKCASKDISELSKFAVSNISELKIYGKRAIDTYKKEFLPSAIRKGINDGESVFLIKNENDKIIGFCNIMPGDGGVFWLDWIIIDKLYRGRGIATAFIPIVLKELRRKGAHAVWLDSRTNNTASIKLFKNNNFHKVKMRKWFFEQDYYIWFKQI